MESMNLKSFLSNRFIKKDSGLFITNTRIGDKKTITGGSYHISDDDYDSFLKVYYNDIVLKNKKEYLTEKQLETDGAILIDLDLRYDYAVDKRHHTKKHILDIVCLYLDELKTMFQFDSESQVPVYVYEKQNVNRVESKNITKDGVHIVIGIKTARKCQIILRERIMSKIKTIWGDLPITNTWDEVFDEGITKGTVGWQLYGSRKPDNEPYKLTYHFDITKDKEDGELIFKSIDINNLTLDDFYKMSARYKEHSYLFMTTNFQDEYNGNTTTVTVKNPIHRQAYKNTDSNDVLKIKNMEELESCCNYFLESLKISEYDLREAYEYTNALPSSYYETGSFSKWIRVGWALCNISDRLFIAWIKMSSKQSKFNFNDIYGLWEKWQTFECNNSNGLTKRSIMYWVREESPTLYKKVLENSIDFFIDKTLEQMSLTASDNGKTPQGCGDYDIASVLYQLYKDEYVCASVKGNIWYCYNNHKWSELDSGTTLRKSISVDLREVYQSKAMKLLTALSHMEPEDEKRKYLKKKTEIIAGIIDRLSRTKDKQNIMTEAKEHFFDDKFLEKLDQNPYLLCFKNGVIDFRTQEFRKGRSDDFISKCTNINYVKIDPAKHSKAVSEIKDFMVKLFPVPELHKYMWDHLSSTLMGTCREQTINMYVGVGQNGKSVLVNLMEKVLGEYKGDVPLSLLTSKERTKIGGLAPELVQLKGVRYAVIQEPSKGDKINEGVMKQLTGGDPIQCRAPYMTKTLTYVPQFKLVVCSNEFMEIKSNDHGTWRRIRVVDFESLFTEKPDFDDTSKPFQYLLDKDLKEKFDTWKEIFASLLINHAYKTNGNVEDCTKVLASSTSYRESQDSIAEFIGTRIMAFDTGCLSKIIVAEQFRDWYQVNHGGRAPTMKDISIQIDKKFGHCLNGLWVGAQMRPII
jgi:P4 family phage/plasmid primase-like protien